MGETPLLQVEGLVTEFATERGPLRAVDGVSFSLQPGATLGVVGESGCGKSVMALSIMRLVPDPPGRIAGGAVRLAGLNLTELNDKALRKLRGRRMAMIFQEPMAALNPVYTVGQQIIEAMRIHDRELTRSRARARAVELLDQVGIPAAAQRLHAYPHELSGGMRQRVMIAIAISCGPQLLIADEPTTALDVTIQAQVLQLLSELQQELSMGIMMITHDLGVVAEFVDRVIVMYAGKVVEYAATQALFDDPLHPYTRGLLGSIPRAQGPGGRRRLATIEGIVPDLTRLPPGCRFFKRCPLALSHCAEVEPELLPLPDGRQVACLVVHKERAMAAVAPQAGGP